MVLVSTWWYWVIIGRYLSVLGGTGSILGGTGCYFVVPGSYWVVLISICRYWVIIGWYWSLLGGTESLFGGTAQYFRGPTEDIIHYFTLMSSEIHYLYIIRKMECVRAEDFRQSLNFSVKTLRCIAQLLPACF